MTRPLRVYLSGSIRKGTEDPRSPDHFWTPEDEEMIRSGIGSPVDLLNPAKADIERQRFDINFGCDLYLVSISDVVLVDARLEKGIGVGAEMMFAAHHDIPVITWAPRETHYRRSSVPGVFGEDLTDWTHPFVFGLSDYVVEELEGAIDLIRAIARGEPLGRNVAIAEMIERYRRSAGFLENGLDGRFLHLGGGVFQDLIGGGARTEVIAGAPRRRFMDFLYLPTETEHLPHEGLLAINRWRERRLAKRPLPHNSRVRRLAASMIRSLGDSPRIFEIGCGKFPICDDVAFLTWNGLEADDEAIRHLAMRRLRAVASVHEIPEQHLQVDVVIALFCMQFAIGDAEFGILTELPDDAVFAFNLPTREEQLIDMRLRQVAERGFRSSVLNLRPTGTQDLLVIAGRSASAVRLEAARAAALRAARSEWPSVAADLEWKELETSVAHRRNMR